MKAAACREFSGIAADPRISRGTGEYSNISQPSARPAQIKSNPFETGEFSAGMTGFSETDFSGIEESGKTIRSGGYEIKISIFRPEGVPEALPVFIFIDGGWNLGGCPADKRLVRDLVTASRSAAVFVNYTRTPETLSAQQINEIYAVVNWVARHGSEINVDGRKLGIVGNNAGGGLAVAASRVAKEKGGPAISFQILI